MTSTPVHVLVTGGAGYIGSHTCKALAAAGMVPVTYDNLSTGNDWAVKYGPLERGDLHDEARLREVIRQYQPIGVIHFAAFSLVGESMRDPLKYWRNNVGGTEALLHVMLDEGVNRIVFSSTAAVYGTPKGWPIREDAALAPINPYGASKLAMEQMLADAARCLGLRAVALRYFNAAGADPSAEIGEAHDPETHLIPLALAAVRGDRGPLTVFGEEYDTPDGTCVRDYIHVNDLADAHLRALDYTGKTEGYAAFNLGTGSGASIREVITAAERVTGRPLPHSVGPLREGDPAVLVADSAAAERELGWVPQTSDLDSILASAWAWMERPGKNVG
ncbi:UDP-glucose 4-epimerase GalE [Sagittula sp. SSi028]|uniref:UDP-glucose 4-epimerase GalE n=1 Tax=Sagittula sp. SSi028 TaxID=3400636 RepID=UPI003AF7082D